MGQSMSQKWKQPCFMLCVALSIRVTACRIASCVMPCCAVLLLLVSGDHPSAWGSG